MIVFLTLCYVGLLALLVKLGVIRLNLWWKLSPVVWMILLLVVLFVPMQWGAPSGPANVYRYVVEIVPNVSGQVVEVPVEPLTPLKQGDVLFRIDPRPFEAEVQRLEAALTEAEQYVPQLKAAYESSTSQLRRAIAERDMAKISFDRASRIQTNNASAIAQQQVDQTQQALLAGEAGVRVAEADQEKARLAYKSEVNGENTTVAQLRAQLEVAKLNLEFATVRAPSDGYVMSLSLRPGQRVVSMPLRSWMAFVRTDRPRVAVAIKQNVLRHVRPGQVAEVVFQLLPGRTYQASVDAIAPINPEGQLQPSGVISFGTVSQGPAMPFGVILTLEADDIQLEKMPGGAAGTAAIYTDQAKPTQLIRRVMIRMQTWMNYVIPM